MQGAKPYSAVTVESLVEKGEWVFPPSSVGVYLSDDGSEFTEAALMSVPQETAGSPDGVKPFKVLFPETSARAWWPVRSIRFRHGTARPDRRRICSWMKSS